MEMKKTFDDKIKKSYEDFDAEIDEVIQDLTLTPEQTDNAVKKLTVKTKTEMDIYNTVVSKELEEERIAKDYEIRNYEAKTHRLEVKAKEKQIEKDMIDASIKKAEMDLKYKEFEDNRKFSRRFIRGVGNVISKTADIVIDIGKVVIPAVATVSCSAIAYMATTEVIKKQAEMAHEDNVLVSNGELPDHKNTLNEMKIMNGKI